MKQKKKAFWACQNADVETCRRFVGVVKMKGMRVAQALKEAMTDWIFKQFNEKGK